MTTAEADVCAMAGCEMVCGRATDDKTMPYISVKAILTKDGEFIRNNHDSGYLNQYDPLNLSKGIVLAHDYQFMEEFRTPRARLFFLTPQIGIREDRRIVAE